MNFVIPYLDDVIIYSKTEMITQNTWKNTKKLRTARFCLNKNKSKFFKHEIEVLGNILTTGKVEPDKQKIKALNAFRNPVNIKEL